MHNTQLKADVLVVGGGAAGIAAAIAAARNGSSVILIEKNAQFGGKATSAVVGTICGAHYRSSNLESKYVTNGFAREFCEAVSRKGKTTTIHHYQGNLHFLPYKPFPFALVADELLKAESNIRIFHHAVITEVATENSKISSVTFLNYREETTITPKKVIDCTGESTVSILAGIPTSTQEYYQASAMVFTLENIKPSTPVQLSLNIIRALKKAILEDKLPPELDKVSLVPGSLTEGSLMLKIALPYLIDNSPNNKTEVEQLGRQAVQQVFDCITERVSFFKDSHLGLVAPEVGTRTGQLSEGIETLTKKEVLECAKHENGIAKGSWPIEIWLPGKNVALQFFDEDAYYEIPAGCLASKHLENLYFAGRIISADQEAIASARVIGTCLSTGFAAGTLAAFSAKGKPTTEAINYIREKQVYR